MQRTITQRLISIEAKLDRLFEILDPEGPTNAAMQADLEAILQNIGQAVMVPAAREVKG